MKKNMRHALASFLAIALVIAITILLNPLRRSEEQIRKNLLKLTPIGTSMEDVISVIEDRKWEIDWINYEHGYGIDKWGTPSGSVRSRDTRIGEKSIRVYIGSYRNIFETGVVVFIGFDADSKLINISVRKDTDAF